MSDPDAPWMTDAACSGVDPELFFPVKNEQGNGADAKRVCACCPVREECEEYAVVNVMTSGIWGGKGQRELRRLRGRRLRVST